MTAKPFHLAWFLEGSSAQGWQEEYHGGIAHEWMYPQIMIDLACALERAGFDYILVEDAPYVGDIYGASMDVYLRNALATPRQDPVVVSTLLLNATKHLGICVTLPTYGVHPYHLARQIGTLDQISGGRAGWNMVTGSSVRAAQNYGLDALLEHDLRYDIADEYMAAVEALWDSWEPDAIVGDPETGVFADPSKVHRVDFEGEHFRTRGPLSSGPAPQGRPVIAQAGGSPRGRKFAAEHADTVVAGGRTVADMKAYREQVRAIRSEAGLDPDSCKLMFGIGTPIIGATAEEAAAKKERLLEGIRRHPELPLAAMSKIANIDFGAFPLDEPLGEVDLTTNGSQVGLPEFIESNRGKTLRQAAVELGERTHGAHGLIGTIDHVAGVLADMMSEIGGDGFLFGGGGSATRRSVAEITDGLVPELQRRGLVRTRYEHDTFRENLLSY
jgi:FMN-dependent oxidoreductase (nitrilotriacetate monooxygenase family)